MNRLIRQIPEGMQDTLPGECRQKRRVEAALRALFARDGFFEVQTPALEYCDAFTGGASGVAPERMYKTFDKQGRVLAVRPDSTTPVMRMVATRMQDAPLPLRLCYVQDVLEYPARPNPRFSQATQAGVELLGESSPEADAEVIALAVRSLLEAGRRVSTRWAEEAVLRCRALDLRMKSADGADSAGELKEFLMELAQEAAG